MNGPLNADNLNAKITEAGETNIEPNYLGFLRENGYSVDELLQAHTVKRSDSERAHLVLKVQTYTKPMDHPDLDVVTDKSPLWVCDCWNFREHSADVSNGEPPTACDPCPHIKQVSKVENAKADSDQDTLV